MHKTPESEPFLSPDFSLVDDKVEFSDIKLDDYGDGYFEYQTKEFGEHFDEEYFKL
ncbi:MAG: hypothetical protein ACK5LL_07245 [Suipraeoptans sp.]